MAIQSQRIGAQKPFKSTFVKESSLLNSSNSSSNNSNSSHLGPIYASTSHHGALLILKDGFAISKDLTRYAEDIFVSTTLESLNAILEACQIKRVNDLVLVTGTTTTGDWDAAVWDTSPAISTRGTRAGVPSTSTSSPQQPKVCLMNLEKTGTTIQFTENQIVHETSGHHHSHSHSPPPHDGSLIQPCCPFEKKNQCVFVRTVRFRRRSQSVEEGNRVRPFPLLALHHPFIYFI